MTRSRILVVEDEAIVAMDLEGRMESLGYDPVCHVSSGEAAIKAASELRPDLVMMDIHLQGEMDGIDAAREIYTRFQIPIVFLTAFSEDETVQRAASIPPFGYLVKPIRDRELKATIEVGLERRQLENQLQQAKSALLENENRLKLALEGADLGMWDWNILTGQVLHDQLWEDLTGYASKECLPNIRSWEELLHPDDKGHVLAELQEHLAGGGDRIDVEFRILARSREYVWIHARGKVTKRGPAGRADRAVGTFRDITERKRMEETRRQFEENLLDIQKLESLGVLAGGIAHDFNNILMTILGNASLLELSVPAGSSEASSVEEIMRAAQRAANLTQKMVAYSGHGMFIVEPVDLSRTVRRLAPLLQSLVPENASLEVNIAKGLPSVCADQDQLQQLLMNLISNAAESMENCEEGQVSIHVYSRHYSDQDLCLSRLPEKLSSGLYVCVEISDTGCGMTDETLEKIFDPFYTTKFLGRGLGMSAVLGIVRGHRGGVFVRSALGQGSTISVLFPALSDSQDDSIN